MIKTVRIDVSAGNPEIPLGDFVAFIGSAISFTLTNIPRELGKRVIERVAVEVRDHQGLVRSFEAERVGSAWGATVADDFFTHTCYIHNGVKITAFGTGNDGAAEQWTLGIGDITILENTVTIQPLDELQELVVVDGAYLENPKKGYFDLGGMRIYDGTRWVEVGGGSANPPMYLHYRKVDGVAGLYTRKMIGDTAVYTLETFASISSQINGRVVECWLAYDDDPSHFNPEETTDRYSRFKLTTAATNLLTFDITGQYAGRMYSRRIKIDNNNVVELGARFEVQNAATALTKTNGTVLKEYLAQSVQNSLDKADSAYQKPSDGIPLSDINASVFPPETHSHAQSEVEGLEAALGGKLDKSGGTMTGNLTLDNSALVLGDRYLAAYTPGVGFYTGDSGFILVPKTNKASDILALLSQLGFTSQDITDVLKTYTPLRGFIASNEKLPGTNSAGYWYYEGDKIWGEGVYHAEDDDATAPGDANFPKVSDAKPGIRTLIDLFGESNSQMVATIDARTPYQLHALVDADKNTDGAFVCNNRAINSLTVGADAVTIEFPTKGETDTYGRDFLIRLTGGSGTVTINLPTESSVQYGDAFPTVENNKKYLIAITETGDDEWYVKSIELTGVE